MANFSHRKFTERNANHHWSVVIQVGINNLSLCKSSCTFKFAVRIRKRSGHCLWEPLIFLKTKSVLFDRLFNCSCTNHSDHCVLWWIFDLCYFPRMILKHAKLFYMHPVINRRSIFPPTVSALSQYLKSGLSYFRLYKNVSLVTCGYNLTGFDGIAL